MADTYTRSKWQVIRVEDLLDADKGEMLALFRRNYDSVDTHKFHADLSKKTFVVCVRDDDWRICGFANIAEFEHRFEGRQHRLIFSGDTIVDPAHWGANNLLDGCLALLAALSERNGDIPTYWFLTTKGHRPYRLLKLYFSRYWPSGETEHCAPELEELCNSAAARYFGEQFSPIDSVKRAGPLEEKPKGELATVSERDAKRDDVRFFLDRIPDCRKGDELVCLARFSRENMTPYSRRFFDPERIARL